IAIDPLTPTTLYLGTLVGLFKSTDGGAHWSPTSLFQHSPLASVRLDPVYVIGGNPSTGTITLVAAAPEGGVTVSLSSSHPTAAIVPAFVTVAAGETSATFTVSTRQVARYVDVTISAILDDATRSGTLVVKPSAVLSSVTLNPATVTGGTSST